MPTTAIFMRDNTFDSNHRHLGFGTIHLVPEEVSAEDAEILIGAGKAEAATPPVAAAKPKAAAPGNKKPAKKGK